MNFAVLELTRFFDYKYGTNLNADFLQKIVGFLCTF